MKTVRIGMLAAALAFSAPAFAGNDAPPDGWLTTKAKLTLINKGELKSSQVHVDSNDGIVTLYGKVRDQAQKNMAEGAVKEIKGVRSVRNLLQIVPPSQEKVVARADDDIKGAAEKMLKEDPALKDSKIGVQSVDKGVVMINGKAATFSDHLRAVSDVDQIAGVRRVVSQIESPEEYGYSERNLTFDKEQKVQARNSLTDTRITAEVKMKLLGAQNVPSRDINVDTTDGVVTLFGGVPDEAAKTRAQTETAAVSGVTRVQNQLEIVPERDKKIVEAKDDAIDKDLKDRFGRNANLKDVKYEVKAGTVRLTGQVATAWEKLESMRLARTIKGVKYVQEDLQIVPREKPANSF